jgi:hypothetical protein
MMEEAGLELISSFRMPESAWLEVFHAPVEKRLDMLEEKHAGNSKWEARLAEIRHEIVMYKKYSDYFGYEFFLVRKAD